MGRRSSQTDSVIFPTPWQVVTGTLELVARRHAVGAHRRLAVARRRRLRAGGAGRRAARTVDGLGATARYVTLNPIFQILRPISPIAWIPIAILWFGVGNVSPIFLIFISSVFPMIVQTTAGVHTIEQRYLRAAENFGVSRTTLFRQVVIPGGAAADHRRHAHRPRRRLAGGGRRRQGQTGQQRPRAESRQQPGVVAKEAHRQLPDQAQAKDARQDRDTGQGEQAKGDPPQPCVGPGLAQKHDRGQQGAGGHGRQRFVGSRQGRHTGAHPGQGRQGGPQQQGPALAQRGVLAQVADIIDPGRRQRRQRRASSVQQQSPEDQREAKAAQVEQAGQHQVGPACGGEQPSVSS